MSILFSFSPGTAKALSAYKVAYSARAVFFEKHPDTTTYTAEDRVELESVCARLTEAAEFFAFLASFDSDFDANVHLEI